MSAQYFVYGRLDSGCSHGVHVSRETALRLIRKARRQRARFATVIGVNGGSGKRIDVTQHSLPELHKGYRYEGLTLYVG